MSLGIKGLVLVSLSTVKKKLRRDGAKGKDKSELTGDKVGIE